MARGKFQSAYVKQIRAQKMRQRETRRHSRALKARFRAEARNARDAARVNRMLLRAARDERRSIRESQKAIRAAKRAARLEAREKKRADAFRSSRPGEYPRKRNGWLRRNVLHEWDQATLTARIGTNVPWGIVLETGRANMEPRPWLSRGMREMAPDINSILTNGQI